MLQDVSVEGGPRALALLRDADTGCLHLTSLRLDLDLFLHFAIDRWTASVTHKPYALDPDLTSSNKVCALLPFYYGHCC